MGVIREYEDSYVMTEDTKMTILLIVIPKEFLKDMREVYNKGKCVNNYNAFLQRLYDEIADRKQDAEGNKGLKGIMAVIPDNGAEMTAMMPLSPLLPSASCLRSAISSYNLCRKAL